MRTTGRTRWPAALALVLACLVVGCGWAADVASGGDDGPDPIPVVPDPYEPAPAPAALPTPTIDEVAADVAALVAGTAYTHSIVIENAATGQVLAELAPTRLLKPASNTKLYTTAAALELLGEDHALQIAVHATAPIGADGTIAGDLHVILEHDFTLSSALYAGPRVPLDRVVRALRARGVSRVTGTVHVSGESVYEANSIGSLNVSTERGQTTSAMADALAAGGIAIGGIASASALAPPPGATPILVHAPITVAVGASPLNVASNNEFADMLIRHIGWRLAGTSSAAAGTAAVLEWLAATGVPADGVTFRDGSGLSHDNRVSARSTVGLFRFMDTVPVGATWLRTLAIAGVRGTIAARLTGDDTRGRVFAKTGTLSDTISLSGALENRHDGQRYLFSIVFNNVTDSTRARGLADAIVRTFAGNLRGSAPRLASPRLRVVRGTGTAGVLEIAWDAVDGADGYVVWLSDDGRVWRREHARYVHATRFLAGELAAARPTFVRVAARGADGLESDPSATYAGTASTEPAAVVLVDGNDRWRTQVENTLGGAHDFLAGLATSTGARPVASVHHAAIDAGEVELAAVPALVWAAGEQSTMDGALTAAERAALDGYVRGGGALIVSGAELVWALADQGSADELAFARDVLGVTLDNDDAGTYELEGAGAMAPLPAMSFLAPDGMDILFPDVLVPATGAEVVLRYVGGTGGAAAVATTTDRRVLVTGFPIEALPSPAARAAILDAALAMLAR